ncbi:MAG: DUF4291 domain-containing protein, partial [Nannocystaceae bacterium]
DFTRDTIVVYQAYSDGIARPALAAQTFVAPFSMHRMTWIKPSFLWLMSRSNWGSKRGQERTLAVRIARAGWERALGEGVLTAYEPGVHRNFDQWEQSFSLAKVHVQWDPERTLRGKKTELDSIQVGVSRHWIREFVETWVVEVRDLTATVEKIRRLRDQGRSKDARRHLPPERQYPTPKPIAARFGMV